MLWGGYAETEVWHGLVRSQRLVVQIMETKPSNSEPEERQQPEVLLEIRTVGSSPPRVPLGFNSEAPY